MFCKSFSSIILVLCFLFCLTSCGQNTKNKKMKNYFSKIGNLYSEVKHYNTEPEYFVEGYQSGCYYEIYVNDILVFKHYENVGLANHAVSINSKILKSGPQKITIKLFPLGEIDGENYTTIDPDDSFRLKIFSRDKQKPYKAFDYDFLQEHKVDIKTSVPYFEETITFNAEVPYTLEGWSNSQVLTEIDQDVLEQEVLLFYNKFSNTVSKKEKSVWENEIYNREKEIAFSRYFNEDDSKRIADDLSLSLQSEYLEVLPIENYNMVFYGNGRIVKLESKKFKKKSALISIEERDSNGQPRKAYIFHGLALHKPKGSNKLEIIR